MWRDVPGLQMFPKETVRASGPLPELETDLLFVYGTLRRGFPLHHHLKRMGAEFVAPGKVRARLLDLGEFPGARKSTGSGKMVEGELFRLHRLGSTLSVLDQIEGFLPRRPETSLFLRATTEVILPNGQRCLAWIYWYR